MRGVLTRCLAVAAFSTALVVAAPGIAPPVAAADCQDINALDEDKDPVQGEGAPLAALQIAAAQDLLRAQGRPLGGGVRVGVVDSGVARTSTLTVGDGGQIYTSRLQDPLFQFFQGTAVAGLIAGAPRGDQLVGIAPDAEVVDLRVYDSTEESEDITNLEADVLARGLERAARQDLDIVNVSLEIDDSPALRRAVRKVTASGAILVAPSGDRPGDDEPFEDEFGTVRDGDDAAQEIFPAGYAITNDRVVAATSTVADGVDPRTVVLPSSATTVAVPTEGGVSYAVNGTRCTLPEASSLYAAATVSGVLALLRSAFPRESPEQLVARLVDTAAGPAIPGPNAGRFQGAGVVQPLEALQRVVEPRKDGGVARLDQPESPDQPAAIDPPDPDLLASAREDAVWWALGAGGLIAVLLLLRPVIGRRRRETDLRT